MDDKIVSLRPAPPSETAAQPASVADQTLANLTAFCERVHEGMEHLTAALVQMDARLRRIELAHNKAEREKLQKTAIFNGHGERVN